MEVVVNGQSRVLSPGTSLARMIQEMGLDQRFLVVEYNGEALARHAIDGITLAEGDRLELVRPVAGG